jgi:hypothetical protein
VRSSWPRRSAGDRLLTGWSLVRIRPGEPNKIKYLGRNCSPKISPKFIPWQHWWQQLADFVAPPWGKAAPIAEQPRDPDFVPLAERLKWYAHEDAIEAAAGISRFTVRLTRQELEAVAARGYPGALAGREGAATAVQAFVSNILLRAIGVTVEAAPLSVLAEMDPFGP